jgi:hypothetical protein
MMQRDRTKWRLDMMNKRSKCKSERCHLMPLNANVTSWKRPGSTRRVIGSVILTYEVYLM